MAWRLIYAKIHHRKTRYLIRGDRPQSNVASCENASTSRICIDQAECVLTQGLYGCYLVSSCYRELLCNIYAIYRQCSANYGLIVSDYIYLNTEFCTLGCSCLHCCVPALHKIKGTTTLEFVPYVHRGRPEKTIPYVRLPICDSKSFCTVILHGRRSQHLLCWSPT